MPVLRKRSICSRPESFSTRKSGGYAGCGSIRTAGTPARPSIAAMVEPARPPPMIAMSVYRIGKGPARTGPIIAPAKANKPLASKPASDRRQGGNLPYYTRVKMVNTPDFAGSSLHLTRFASRRGGLILQAPEALLAPSFRLDLAYY